MTVSLDHAVAAPRRGRRWLPLCGAARFEAAMRTRPVARSDHFMLHHRAVDKLSTTCDESGRGPVDDWRMRHLGMVIAKRFAKRAVTRVLIKRQVREAMQRHALALAPGDWVLRLRAPIDRQAFPSAASRALATAVRGELEQLFAKARCATPLRPVAGAAAAAEPRG